MSTQPELDFYARVPTWREANNARLSEQRSAMYAWRHDAQTTVFDPITGARRPQTRLYTPLPTRHSPRPASTGLPAETFEMSEAQHRQQLRLRQEQQQNGRRDTSPGQPLSVDSPVVRPSHSGRAGSREDGAAWRASSGRPQETEADGEWEDDESTSSWDDDRTPDVVWASAAPHNGSGDRRRWWRQTNFTFSPQHFRSSGRAATADAAYSRNTSINTSAKGAAEVYTPYIHDSIVFCKPVPRAQTAAAGGRRHKQTSTFVNRKRSEVVLAVTSNAAEARAREVQAAEQAAHGEMLSLSSLSPVPRGAAPAKPYTLTSAQPHSADRSRRVSRGVFGATDLGAAAAAELPSPVYTPGAYGGAATGGGGGGGGGAAMPLSPGSLDGEMSSSTESRWNQYVRRPDSAGGTPAQAAQPSPPQQPQHDPTHEQSNSNNNNNNTSISSGRSKRYGTAVSSSRSSAGGPSSALRATTWCDVVGPSIASKQRALTMAEGVYRDLLLSASPRGHTAAGAAAPSLRMATVPTGELAYSLRASYMAAQTQRHAQDNSRSLPHPHRRPTSSGKKNVSASSTAAAVAGNGRKGSSGVADSASHLRRSGTYTTTPTLPSGILGNGIEAGSSSMLSRSPSRRPSQHRRASSSKQPQRPASVNTAVSSNSGLQGNSFLEKGPHRRTVTAVGLNGLCGASFLLDDEDAADGAASPTPLHHGVEGGEHEAASTDSHDAAAAGAEAEAHVDSVLTGVAAPTTTEVPAVMSSNGGAGVQAATVHAVPRPSPTLQYRLPSSRDLSVSTSSEAEGQPMGAASPLGCVGVGLSVSTTLTAVPPPNLSQFQLEAGVAGQGDAQERSGYRGGLHGVHYGGAPGNVNHNINVNSSSSRISPLAATARRSSRYTASPTSEMYGGLHQPTFLEEEADPDSHTQTNKKQRVSPPQQQQQQQKRKRRGQSKHRGGSGSQRQPMRAARGMTRSQTRDSRTASRSSHAHDEVKGAAGSAADGSAGRLPAEAKETRVYAVRLRANFTTADAAGPVWHAPPRRGVPVLLPGDWQ